MTDSSEKTPLINSDRVLQDAEEKEKSIDTNKEEFSFSRITRREKLLLLSMGLMNFFACTCFSLLAPFFPAEAARKGVSTTVTGFIFGVFEFVIFISSPIFGNYITRIGSKFMFSCGTFVTGTCAILFGVLDRCPDGIVYIVMCFCCRVVEALGCSAYVTALFAITASVFPDNVSTVFGALETFSGIGMMVGPAIGGALYTAGGFGLPFFVMGSVVILYGMFCLYLMPEVKDHHSKLSKPFYYLLKSPLALVSGFSILVGAFSLGFMDPTLAQHLSKLDLNTWQIGLMFLIAPGIYAFTAPLWGWITDSKGYVKTMIFIGNLLSVLAFLMLGPTSLIPFFPFNIWFMIISLIILGLMVGCALIPTFKGVLQGALQIGMPENMDTHGIVSGYFNSLFSLGACLGPTVGGAFVDKFGFNWGSTGVACLFLLAAFLTFLYGLPSSMSSKSLTYTVSQTDYLKIEGENSSVEIMTNGEAQNTV
ncbi:MFS-type transporter SLC18B1-like [Mytilus trossulus]|uniref:MFS-type transporter SLC18B1-like n=1 Tax=Mytilus trossulus TaxID=6551 RepID=UPI003005BF94